LSSGTPIDCCSNARSLRAVIERSTAVVVQVRVLPVPSMFPAELRDAVDGLPFEAACVVAPPSVVEEAGFDEPRLGEALVFGCGRLLGRIHPKLETKRERLLGLLSVGLAPRLGRGARDESALPVLGVAIAAPFEEVVNAAFRALADWRGTPER
jgi:hypothetical protein